VGGTVTVCKFAETRQPGEIQRIIVVGLAFDVRPLDGVKDAAPRMTLTSPDDFIYGEIIFSGGH